MDNIIDGCITNNSDYDIANVIYIILKNNFRYIENNVWEYLEDNKWYVDKKNEKLKHAIKTIVCKEFIERSIFWAKKTETVNSKSDMISSKLLFIGTKLKEDKYISNIIKECKQFFINNEY